MSRTIANKFIAELEEVDMGIRRSASREKTLQHIKEATKTHTRNPCVVIFKDGSGIYFQGFTGTPGYDGTYTEIAE